MIAIQDIRDALTMCTGYDPVHFPRPSEVMAAAWMQHFSMYPMITGEDLADAIARYYKTPSRPVPQPADIRVLASEIRRERYERSSLDSAERLEHEAICDARAAEVAPEVAAARQRAIAVFAFRPTPVGAAESRRRLVERVRRAAPPQPMPAETEPMT